MVVYQLEILLEKIMREVLYEESANPDNLKAQKIMYYVSFFINKYFVLLITSVITNDSFFLNIYSNSSISHRLNFTINNIPYSFPIDQSFRDICFYLHTYKYPSSSHSKIIINYTSSFGGGIEILDVEDLFTFENYTKPIPLVFKHYKSLPFYSQSKNYFGLGYSKNLSLSFTHQLYNKKIIDYPQYTIEFNNNNSNGVIYFGSITKELIKDHKYQSYCNINNTEEGAWNCKLKKVKLQNNNINDFIISNYTVTFNIKNHYTTCPLPFLTFIRETLLKNYLLSKQCIDQSIYGFGIVTFCDCHIIDSLTDIIFYIGKFKYNIKAKYFFSLPREENNKCLFQLMSDKYTHQKTQIIFGYYILKYFIITFDYMQKKVFLYSEDVEILYKELEIIKRMTYTNLVILSIGCGLLIKLY